MSKQRVSGGLRNPLAKGFIKDISTILHSKTHVYRLFLLGVLGFALLGGGIAEAQDAPAATGTVKAGDEKAPVAETAAVSPEVGADISNELINIVVNARDSDTGRYSLTTKKGDPTRARDDNKMLIYGQNLPWTSFVTVRIDGKDYVYGGPTKRRAGKGSAFGDVVEKPHEVDGGAIVMKCKFGGVVVTQTLSITSGPVSGLFDTLKIVYGIENNDSVSHKVGIRVVLDTLLGDNDGAPFKVGERSIQRELMLTGDKIPEYWIAFDSLDNPGVVSRGTLRGRGLSAPDRLLFANWGKLADNIWQTPYSKGQSFLRAGEDELDSAIALYWDEADVAPGGARSVSTLYGIEYLNVAVDILSIGTLRDLGKWPTAPNQIKTYSMYAYIKNTVDFDMKDVAVNLTLPEGLKFADGESAERKIGKLEPGHEVTVGWRLEPIAFAGADDERDIIVSGKSNLVKEVKVKTKVTLLAAPDVKLTVDAPPALELVNGKEYGPANPFAIEVHCKNSGMSSVDNMVLKLDLPAGLVFPAAQTAEKTLSRLDGRDEVVFTWKVIATGENSGPLKYTIGVKSDSTQPKSQDYVITVPALPTKVEVSGVPEGASPGNFFPAEIFASNLRDLDKAEFTVMFDPAVIDVVRVSQGTAFVEGMQARMWKEPVIDNKKGVVSGISGSRGAGGFSGNGSLAIIHFRIKGAGKTNIEVMALKLTDTKGAAVDYALENASLSVEGEK